MRICIPYHSAPTIDSTTLANKRKLIIASTEAPTDAQIETKKAKKADTIDETSTLTPSQPELVEEEDAGDKDPAANAKADPEEDAEETLYFVWTEGLIWLMDNIQDECSLRYNEHVMDVHA